MYTFTLGGHSPGGEADNTGLSPLSPDVGYGPVRSDVCFEVAILKDADARKLITICGGDERKTFILLTKSHVVQIEITNPKLSTTIGAFLLKYQGTMQYIFFFMPNYLVDYGK